MAARRAPTLPAAGALGPTLPDYDPPDATSPTPVDRRAPDADTAAQSDRAAPDDDVRDILRRLNGILLERLPPSVLAAMEASLVADRHKLRDRALDLERRLHEGLARGDGVRLTAWLKAARQIAAANDDIDQQIARARGAFQQRVLDDRMAGVLRGRRNVQVLEALVLVLIVVVLSLLACETLEPDLSLATRRTILLVDTACCIVFLLEFALRLRCAESKGWFWRHHWIDLGAAPVGRRYHATCSTQLDAGWAVGACSGRGMTTPVSDDRGPHAARQSDDGAATYPGIVALR